MGKTWEGWLVFLGQTRDSDCLTRSNFIVARDALYKRASVSAADALGEETVQSVTERHWACGWVEWIAIHPSDLGVVALANEIAAKLDSYPVVDEDHWSQLEHNEACENWDRSSVHEELSRAGVCAQSIARLPHMDRDDAAFIRETWASDGADYETRDDGGVYFRFSDIGRDRAAWAIKWLRSTK